MDPEVVYSVSFWMVLVGIFGARTFYVVQKWPQFHREPLAATFIEVINFTKGGIVVYGALIGGLAAAVVFVHYRKLSALKLGDVLAPGMLLGLAVGRIGCLMNGCCFGGVCELPAAPQVRFPFNSPAYVHQKQHGQMHGIRIGEDARGRVTIKRVESDGPARATNLEAGDVVKSIQLSAWRSLEAAQRVPEFAGAELEVVTEDGRTARIAIQRSPPTPHSYYYPNEIGLQVRPPETPMPEIATVVRGGAAEKAGLKVGDRLSSVRLPPTANVAAAHNVLQCAGARLTIETEDGRSESWSAGRLPDRCLPVHPTQIYSSINAALLCLLLWAWFPFRRRDGEVFALMLTLYPITRILLELVRDDEPAVLGAPLTISQVVSLMVLLAAAVLWVRLLRRGPHSELAVRQAA
jgi:phosphatidylglycerol:prolipoprotein diacylglycerol transferase